MANVIDRDLLRLAAKAAGVEASLIDIAGKIDGYDVNGDAIVLKGWDPLTSDDDAFRLLVLLGLWITYEKIEVQVRHFAGHYLAGPTYITERRDSPDPYTATRRAIVRAAAEIGKVMP